MSYLGDKMTIQEWKDTVLKKYLLKNKLSKGEIKHLEDWLKKTNPKLSARLAVPEALKKSEEWTQKINESNRNVKSSGKVEEIISFPDGLRWVRLCGEVAKKWEGLHMGHCVASYTSHKNIYSLRDKNQIPHITLEIYYNEVEQIQGKANTTPHLKYLPYVKEFLKIKNMSMKGEVLARDFGCYAEESSVLKVLEEEYEDFKVVEFGEGAKFPFITEKTKAKGEISFNTQILAHVLSAKRFDLALELIQKPNPFNPVFYSHVFGFIVDRLVLSGQVNLLKTFIDKNPLDKWDSSFNRYVVLSVSTGCWEMVDYVLENICKNPHYRSNALCCAAREGHAEMCKKILDKYVPKPTKEVKAEAISVSASHPKLFEYFYELGFREPEWRNSLLNAKDDGEFKVAKKILDNYQVEFSVLSSAFMSAVLQGKFNYAELIFSKDEDGFKKDRIMIKLKDAMVTMGDKRGVKYMESKINGGNS